MWSDQGGWIVACKFKFEVTPKRVAHVTARRMWPSVIAGFLCCVNFGQVRNHWRPMKFFLTSHRDKIWHWGSAGQVIMCLQSLSSILEHSDSSTWSFRPHTTIQCLRRVSPALGVAIDENIVSELQYPLWMGLHARLEKKTRVANPNPTSKLLTGDSALVGFKAYPHLDLEPSHLLLHRKISQLRYRHIQERTLTCLNKDKSQAPPFQLLAQSRRPDESRCAPTSGLRLYILFGGSSFVTSPFVALDD